MANIKVGILGSGPVGQTLASGFAKNGYDVMIGTRNKDKLNDWKKTSNYSGKIASFQETAEFGDIIVLAVTGRIAVDFIKSLKRESLTKKTIIDTTNPIDESAPVNGVLNYFTEQNQSLMEQLQKAVPDANFVKAFNSIGSAFMVNPDFKGNKPSMFICGNNDKAKQEVKKILEKFGWEAEDMGFAEASRPIEDLCRLWCIPGLLKNQWTHAFKFLKFNMREIYGQG